jgi:hypothetical protein
MVHVVNRRHRTSGPHCRRFYRRVHRYLALQPISHVWHWRDAILDVSSSSERE